MIMTSRSVFSNNSVLEDISLKINDFREGSFVMPYVATEDYLYIGSDFPFNHRYIDLTVVNDQSASLTVEVWDADEWKTCVDIIDETSVGGIALSASGNISWRVDDRDSWSRWDTNNEGETVEGLTGVKIFDMYWARLSWSANLKPTTEINFIGHRFSDDLDLETFYPVLNKAEVKAQFKDGKTTWKEQQLQAAETIIRDLKRKQVIRSGNQILDWTLFKEASSHKVAEYAYNEFGPDYKDRRDDARLEYKKALDVSIYLIDKDNDARVDVAERVLREGFLTR